MAIAAPLLAVGGAAHADDDYRVFVDLSGDAVVRRTDTCNCGPLLPGQAMPDLKKIVISAWQPDANCTSPYEGELADHLDAHLVRIDLVFNGLVNPPGTLGLNGQPFDPFVFGTNPLYGFVELDVDNDEDTGGDQTSVAATHYLANAARFGGRPSSTLSVRAASASDDLYQTWTVPPQVSLSGADWVMAFCGCFETVPLWKSNANCPTFGPGCTWIVSGRYFQRTTGYLNASTMTGGTGFGLYDPVVNLRFQHEVSTNETTVTLVYALDQIGAGQLAQAPPEPIDHSAANQTSIAEGVADLIQAAQSGFLTDLAWQVTHRWANKTVSAATDPTRWRPTFIFGTSYAAQTDGLYVWTDIGFDCLVGDVNGDGVISAADRSAVALFISQFDGSDGVVDGQVVIPNFAVGFSVFDVNGDGVVGALDLAFYPNYVCPADFDQSGMVDVLDIFSFLNTWFSGSLAADVNQSGTLTVQDIFDFLNRWFTGC
ncbi:MAG TPA: GC-type dockerin domain-anchored protein [Phycisphaerales bacterium]|nr:GC-type dockerin domain-anchored protein [Phycisphaerales bacterium]